MAFSEGERGGVVNCKITEEGYREELCELGRSGVSAESGGVLHPRRPSVASEVVAPDTLVF